MKILSGFILLLVAIVVFYGMCVQKVRLGEVGVKSDLFGEGIVAEDLEAGYHLILPGLHRLDILDPTTQVMIFQTNDSSQSTKGSRYRSSASKSGFNKSGNASIVHKGGDSLELRLSDQFTVTIDLTVLYRIQPGKAHKVLAKTPTVEQQRRIVNQSVRKQIQDVFGDMVTENFYNTAKRMSASVETRVRLVEDLKESYIDVIDVLVRNITYDRQFEKQLLNNQLMKQRQSLNMAKTQLVKAQEITQGTEAETTAKCIKITEERNAEITRIKAETQREVIEMLARADKYKKVIVATAESEKRIMTAKGELLKITAHAVGETEVAKAYGAKGSELYLTRQLIDSVEIGEIEINTNRVNPFDVKELLEMLGAK